MHLFVHPFSSYRQKVLIALYENATPFEFRSLEKASAKAELASLWPLKRFPALLDQVARSLRQPRSSNISRLAIPVPSA